MLTCTALELQAHGHPGAARRLLERAAAWYDAQLPAGAAEEIPTPCTSTRFDPRYYLGRFDQARVLYERAVARDSSNVVALAALAALAIRNGDTAVAARLESRLTRESLPGVTLLRARLAALRGDRDRAVALLRGQPGRGPRLLHADPDLAPLHGYPPYEELVHPRD
jgi:hypothetical protein